MYFSKKLKDLLTLSASNIVAKVIFGLFWLFLASIMTKVEYGELGFLMSIANVAAAISLLGLGAVVMVYEPKKHNILPASFVLILISSSIAGVISFAFTQNFFLSILIVGMSIFNIILVGLNSKKRYTDYSKHVLIRSVSTVFLAIILYQFLGLNGIILGYFFTAFFVLLEFSSLMKNKKIEFSVLKSKIKFMMEMLANRSSGILLWWGDKIIVGALFGFSVLGEYYFASQYVLLLEAIPRSISQYLLPQESEGKKNKKIKIFSVAGASIITIISIIFAPYGITQFLPQYQESILPMQILSLALIPLSITVIQTSELLGREKSRIVVIGAFLQIGIYFASIILLGQSFGLVGLAIGFLVSTIARTIFNLIAKYRVSELFT